MKTLNSWLYQLTHRQDLLLAAMLLLAVFMIIIPLPTPLVDLLIAINLTLSLLLLMMALYIREPMEFSAFPAVLLMTTLYRLALTISTSRLILLQHDAGEIVYTFGNFAVGGNLAVGIIVFAIITIVQFIVITKGSERVAEVSARFSLDGMPGKQMSIDGDMRAGIIDANEARFQRTQVQKESQLYGAMDGAMKFVKGDAIAAIIIILVNIIGGISIGVFMNNMSASEATATYTLLSIGDGLVAQIPSLLISIAAGIIVTRVPNEIRRNLANELSAQILRQRQVLWVVCVVLLIFALLPGFPSLIFIVLATLIAGGNYWLSRRANSAADGHSADNAGQGKSDDPASFAIGATPLLLCLHPARGRGKDLPALLAALRSDKFQQLGLPVPEIQLQLTERVEVNQLQLQLYQETVLDIVLPDLPLLAASCLLEDPPIADQQQVIFGNITLRWVNEAQAQTLQHSGVTLFRHEERIIHLISLALDRYCAEFVGVQETRYLMDKMEQRYSELVKELQRQLPIGRIADIIKRLIEEGIAVRDLRTIFEALVEWAPREKDPIMLTEYVRLALRRHIVGKIRRTQPWIKAWLIGGHIEQMIRESIRQTSAGSYSALSPEQNQLIMQQIQSALQKPGSQGSVLVTTIDIRRFVRKLIEKTFFYVDVLSFQELDEEKEMKVLGHIEVMEESRDVVQES